MPSNSENLPSTHFNCRLLHSLQSLPIKYWEGRIIRDATTLSYIVNRELLSKKGAHPSTFLTIQLSDCVPVPTVAQLTHANSRTSQAQAHPSSSPAAAAAAATTSTTASSGTSSRHSGLPSPTRPEKKGGNGNCNGGGNLHHALRLNMPNLLRWLVITYGECMCMGYIILIHCDRCNF